MQKKILTGVVALLTVFSMTTGLVLRASADTVVTTTTTTSSFVYTRDLTIGSTGADVVALQTMLVGQGDLVMPVGVAYGYFGTLTQAALAKYQAAHGISPAAGYFGPITRAYVAANGGTVVGTLPPGCTSTSGFSTTTGQACNSGSTLPAGCLPGFAFSSTTGQSCTGTTSSSGGFVNLGETSISNFDLSDPDDDSINEGANKAQVAQFTFDVKNADAELSRVDAIFDGSTNTSGGTTHPWSVFDKVYLMKGSTVLASVDTSSKDAWDETSDNNIYRVRLSDINDFIKQDASGDYSIAADIASGVDAAGTDEDWKVYIATDKGNDDGARFLDSAGIDTFVGEGTTGASFSIVKSGSASQVTVSEDSSSPDATTLEVKDSTTVEDTVAIFNVKNDADGGDITLTDFPVQITVDNAGAPTSTFDSVISKVYVTIDGTKYSGDYVANSCGASTPSLSDCLDGDTATFTFNNINNDNIVVQAGDNTNAEVSVKFKSQGTNAANYNNGTTITASSDLTPSDVEDASSGDNISDVSGSADGELFTVASTGLGVQLVGTPSTSLEGTDANQIGHFTFVVDVTAFGDDQWVELSGTRGTTESNTGFNYQILDGSNSVVATGTSTISASADKTDDGSNRVRISQNETVRFTVDVFFDAAASAPYKVNLYSVNFAQSNIDATDQQVLSPDSTYRTGPLSINA